MSVMPLENGNQTEANEELKDRVIKNLKNEMAPELLSRIDQIIVFKPLGFPELRRITAEVSRHATLP